MSLLELYCHVDDFWKIYEPIWKRKLLMDGQKRYRACQMSMSEMITLVVHFHQKRYRDFKTYYTTYVMEYLQGEFPRLLSYNRFVQLLRRILQAMCAYLQSCYGQTYGIAFIDSTPLAVCHNRRILQHRTFKGIAQRGHTSVGWFFGFKLHIVVNEYGEILNCCATAGNVDDRRPVPKLVQQLFGKVFGDKGYLSKPLKEELRQEYGVDLITKVRSNMKAVILSQYDRYILRKRAIIESINDQLKNISQIEHTRHRSLAGFMTNLIAGLVAYCHQSKKPSLNLDIIHPFALT